MAFRDEISAKLEIALKQLRYEESADRKQLEKILFDFKVADLKLLCKELRVKVGAATKAELVGRLLSRWQIGMFSEEDSSVTAPSTLTPAVKQQLSALPPFESVKNWVKDLSALKDFTFMDLYTYLIESKDKEFDHKSLRSFKSLKAYSYFKDELVRNVWMSPIQGTEYIYARCHCMASLTAKKVYTVYVCLNTEGVVFSAKCICKAGLGQACSHVAALLFTLDDLKRKGTVEIQHDTTCTSALQQWHVPPKRDVTPLPVKDISFPKQEYGKEFRAKIQGDEDSGVTGDVDADAVKELLEIVGQHCPNSGLFHFWVMPAASTEKVDEQTGMDRQVQELVIYKRGSAVPAECDALQDVDPQSAYFQELVSQYMLAQHIPATVGAYIESITREQNKSMLWHQLHNGRVTSSIFGDVILRKATTSPDNLIRRIMGYTDHIMTKAMKWGLANESRAQDAYVKHCESAGKVVSIIPSALSLYPSHSYLGASGDGWVCQGGNCVGMLEIKCPFSLDNEDVTTTTPVALADNPKFCLEKRAEIPKLKTTHKYYYQVQGELAITGMAWCDFVIWTEGGLFVQRVPFDEDLWQSVMLPKLVQFYSEHVVAEILCRRLQRSS